MRTVDFKWGNKIYKEVIEGNIELGEMSPDDMSDALNRAVGNFAFYGALRADAKKMLSQIEAEYGMWFALKTQEITKNPDYKKITTEKARVQQVMMDNAKEWETWEQKKRSVQLVIDKAYVLVQSFELMTRTLQSVLAFRRQELGSINHSASPMNVGAGNLEDDFTASNTRLHKG